MADKIRHAAEYVQRHADTLGEETAINDAANTFADSYKEYMTIWYALTQEG